MHGKTHEHECANAPENDYMGVCIVISCRVETGVYYWPVTSGEAGTTFVEDS